MRNNDLFLHLVVHVMLLFSITERNGWDNLLANVVCMYVVITFITYIFFEHQRVHMASWEEWLDNIDTSRIHEDLEYATSVKLMQRYYK